MRGVPIDDPQVAEYVLPLFRDRAGSSLLEFTSSQLAIAGAIRIPERDGLAEVLVQDFVEDTFWARAGFLLLLAAWPVEALRAELGQDLCGGLDDFRMSTRHRLDANDPSMSFQI